MKLVTRIVIIFLIVFLSYWLDVCVSNSHAEDPWQTDFSQQITQAPPGIFDIH